MKDAKTSKHSAPHPKKHTLRRVILALLLILVLAAGAVALLFRREITGGGASGQTVTVTVDQGSGVAAIARNLKQAGVIRFPRLFRWYVGRQGAASKLQYGTFELEQGASYDELIQALSVYAAAESTRLTFPEGTTAIAIAQQMEKAGLCTAEEFLTEANEGDFSEYRFWQYVPSDEEAPGRFMKCEGYLFPDTYEFLNDGTVHDYVATFYARFDQMITDEIYASLEEQGMTLHQLVTLASFVQEEAGNDQDSNVAQVFRNRLAEGSPYPRLESNVSSYIQSDEDNNYLWNWVAPWYGGWDAIPQEIIDAYDTYSRSGLPAGPVSNPGLEAIRAALNPQPDEEAQDAYFFVTDLTGHYYYAKTLAEHQANVKTARQVNAGL
ncbi:endolytic transglycosylase MltG [Faecalibacterium sp. An122]|uniref:endolytic transglycosylase MltG n=1 Tax=Faecalibacterium sp. An122 TaxID=1965551 RepID=UPI000B3A607D|nr:endolytic transglycosylase MltG [Faecalibacterium sp. An122]OUQ39519.1 aminodeoxychorismate lyase [Faecalibacterium sp. An122]